MGAGLTASEVRQIIGALQSIERELKIHNKREAERDARQDARQVPPADPMGYTE